MWEILIESDKFRISAKAETGNTVNIYMRNGTSPGLFSLPGPANVLRSVGVVTTMFDMKAVDTPSSIIQTPDAVGQGLQGPKQINVVFHEHDPEYDNFDGDQKGEPDNEQSDEKEGNQGNS